MKETKKQFKWFSITQYEQEQEYLSEMHKKGWKLVKVAFPGWYHFEKCEPEDVVYQLDYNQDGIANKEEYTQLFEECGWEYLFDFVGYSYFRKRRDENEMDTAIFCDDASRLDMMSRVFKGRMLPVLVIFCAVILPQLSLHMDESAGGLGAFIRNSYIIMFFAYVVMMGTFAWQYFHYELKVLEQPKKTKTKLFAILGVLGVLSVVVAVGGLVGLGQKESVYSVSKQENGYSISAEYFDELVEEQFALEAGDEIRVTMEHVEGKYSIVIGCEGKEPVFTGNGTFLEGFSVTVPEAGNYTISCEGIGAKGNVEFLIRD